MRALIERRVGSKGSAAAAVGFTADADVITGGDGGGRDAAGEDCPASSSSTHTAV